MNERRDLGIALIGAAVLLVGVAYFAQCRSKESSTGAPSRERPAASAPKEEHEEARKPKSLKEMAEEEDNEERAKIQKLGHALQTIGANPTLRRTFNLPK